MTKQPLFNFLHNPINGTMAASLFYSNPMSKNKYLSPYLKAGGGGGGGLAQWLASQTTDQWVPGSRTGRVAICCGLEQVTFTPCLILVVV